MSQNDGLFPYSSNGQQAVPWGSSTSYKCVVPPLLRTPVKKSTGTIGQCDGLATIDLNAFWGSAPAKNPGEGAVIGQTPPAASERCNRTRNPRSLPWQRWLPEPPHMCDHHCSWFGMYGVRAVLE